jgi:AmiR/NasT family two-component response regulator
VEEATTLLREAQGLSEPEAFALLRRAAMDRRVTLPEAAAEVVQRLGAKRSQTGHE